MHVHLSVMDRNTNSRPKLTDSSVVPDSTSSQSYSPAPSNDDYPHISLGSGPLALKCTCRFSSPPPPYSMSPAATSVEGCCLRPPVACVRVGPEVVAECLLKHLASCFRAAAGSAEGAARVMWHLVGASFHLCVACELTSRTERSEVRCILPGSPAKWFERVDKILHAPSGPYVSNDFLPHRIAPARASRCKVEKKTRIMYGSSTFKYIYRA